MDSRELTEQLKTEARRLGFDLVGATAASPAAEIARLERWLDQDFAGGMDYIRDRLDAYRNPNKVLDGAKSILMLGMNYRTVEPASAGAGQGSVARYGWGRDYHDVIRDRLHALADFHRTLVPSAGVRGVVDTAPLLERDYARAAGLGWIGRNTMLIHERFGSWTYLAALLTTEELAADMPMENRCDSCTACVDACPTGALRSDGFVDARKCLSYLTIELRDAIPDELRRKLGSQLFGCECCQNACPFNRETKATDDEAFRPLPGMNPVDLIELMTLDDEAFRRRFRGSPFWRAKRRGILRNAATVLGNRPCASATDTLTEGLDDDEPLIRNACAWALSRYETKDDPASDD